MTMIKRRMRNIESALGYEQFWKECQRFFGQNNFKDNEILAILHHINSCYILGADVENIFETEEQREAYLAGMLIN